MIKLMKYEFRKQLLSKIVILITLAGLELLFLYGLLIAENHDVLVLSIGLLIFLTFGAMFFVSFESILTFSNDLRTKHSYMLFLTPNSAYKIVGAKVVSSIIQIFLTWMAFALVAVMDMFLITVKFSNLGRAIDLMLQVLDDLFSFRIDISDLILVLVMVIISWIATVIIAFLSITLSATFLANIKARGIISVAFFFLITFLVNKFRDLFVPETSVLYNRSNVVATCIVMGCATIISYVVTSWMLDKKVSL